MSKEEVMAVCNKMNIAVSEEDLKDIMSKLVHVSVHTHNMYSLLRYVDKMAGSELIWMVHLKVDINLHCMTIRCVSVHRQDHLRCLAMRYRCMLHAIDAVRL